MQQIQDMMERAYVLKEVRRYTEAIELLNNLLTLDPENLEAMRLQCICMLYKGNKIGARIMADQMLAVNSNSDTAYFFHAEMYYETGYYEEAIEMINEAIRIYPHSPQYFAGESKYFTTIGDPDKGLELAEESRRLNPEYAFAYTAFAIAHKTLGNFELAEENLQKALYFKPGYYIFYHMLGEIYRITNNKTKAIEMYKTALSLSPDYADSAKALKELLEENGASNKWHKRLGRLFGRR